MTALVNALRRLVARPVLTWWTALFAVAFTAQLVSHLSTLPDVRAADRPETGDFLAFYVGGTLVADGRGDALYDLEAQRATQALIQGGPRTYAQVYLNPPALAAAVAPTVALGYRGAYLVFCALMAASLAATLQLLRGMAPALLGTSLGAFTLLTCALASPGIARSVGGGQYTPLTTALVAAAVVGVHRGSPWVTGAALGLLTYKPQHLLLVLPLLLVSPGVREIVGVFAAFCAAQFALGAALCGPAWPAAFLHNALAYGAVEVQEAQLGHVSLPRALGAAFGSPGGAVGWALGGALFAVSARRLRIAGRVDGAAAASAIVAAMLVSPHFQYYDAGIALVTVVLLVGQLHRASRLTVGARVGVLALAIGWETARPLMKLGVQPTTLVLLALWLWAWRASDQE
jgi:hypothetical protein